MADIKVGNIYAELSLDMSNLSKTKKEAIKRLNELKDEGTKIMQSAGGALTESMKIRLKDIEKNKAECLRILDSLNKEIKEKQTKIMEDLASMIKTNIAAPLVNAANHALDTFSSFEQSMQNTFSVMGATASDMKMLEEVAKKMGETTRFSASEAADALYSLGSAGQSASDAANSLQGVLRLAGATGSELAYTSETIVSILSQFNLKANKASHVADVFSKAISKSQANISKLAYSMKYVGPVASGLGISLETTTAALMKLYNTGYGGEQAGTYLRQAFQRLASGTNDLKNKLKELGISYDKVNPQTKDFSAILDELKEHNIGVTESIAIFGDAAGGAMAKLIEEGGQAIKTMEGVLVHSEGTALEMQNIQNTSFANTQAELKSVFEALEITVGSILAPAIDTLTKGFIEILKTINSLPVGIQTFITSLSVATVALTPFLALPALIAKIRVAMQLLNTTMLQNPIFISAAVIAGVAAAIYSIYNQTKTYHKDLIDSAKKGVEQVKSLQQQAFEAGSKGRAIEELLSRYEALKNNTAKTKEQQEEYNQTLERLKELVPDVVVSINKTGEAYIENIEKVKLATLQQLKLEKEKNEIAKNTAAAASRTAKNIQTSTSRDLEEMKKEKSAVENLSQDLNLAYNIFYEKLEAYKKEKRLNRENNTHYSSAKEALEKYLKETTVNQQRPSFDDYTNPNIPIEKSLDEKVVIFKKFLTNLNDETSAFWKRYNTAFTQNMEAKDIIAEFERLSKQQEVIEKQIQAVESKKKQSKKEYIASIIKAYNEEVNSSKALAQAYGEQFKETDKRLEILREKISHLQGLGADFFQDGVLGATDLIEIRKEMERLLKLKRQTSQSKPQQKESSFDGNTVDKSLDGRLKRLDDQYKEEMELAKSFGKNITEIEKEWAEQRKNILNAYIEARAKTIEEDKNLQEAERKAKIEAIKEESTGGVGPRARITINDEIIKTHRLMLGELDKMREEYERKAATLEKIIEDIHTAQAMLTELETSNNSSNKNIEEVAFLENHIDNLQEQARSLAQELGSSFATVEDAHNAFKNFENDTNTKFVSRFAEIAKMKNAAIKEIEAASKVVGNDEAGQARLKEIERAVNSTAKKAAAVVGLELASRIMDSVSSLTSSILGVLEKEEVKASDVLEITSALAQTLEDCVPGVVTKAVIKAIKSIINFVKLLVSFSERMQQKNEEKKRKAIEEEHKKQIDMAKKIAGEVARIYMGYMQGLRTAATIAANPFLKMKEAMKENKIKTAIETFKNAHVEATKTIEKEVEVKGWYKTKRGTSWYGKHKETVTEEVNLTVDEAMQRLYEAYEAGDEAGEKYWERQIERARKAHLIAQGLKEKDITALSRYMKGIEDSMIEAIKTKDYASLKVSIKEKMREAILDRLKDNLITSKIKKLINDFDETSWSKKERLEVIEKEITKLTQSYTKEAEKFAGALGLVATEMEEHIKEWSNMKSSIKEALSSSLGEAAYNADWNSFKKAFANEMKKAIISAAIANSGVKTQIDAIIKSIMEDGKITSSEINYSISSLKDIFDKMEGGLAEISRVVESFNGGVDVKHETKGAVIQKLSGDDREWFTEVFRENFKKLAEGFNAAMIDLKQIQYAQITVLNATLNVNIVNINARDNMSLKDFLAELIQQARQS